MSSTPTHSLARWGCSFLVLVMTSCTGRVGGDGVEDPGTGTSGGNNSGTGAGNGTNGSGSTTTGGSGTASGGATGQTGAAPAMFRPAPSGLRRLTRPQYTNSIHDLLGEDVTVPSNLEPDTVLAGFASIGAALTTLPATATEKFENAALTIADQVMTDATRRARLVTCAPTDPNCVRMFVTNFGKRAWRRPLTDVEISRYAAIAKMGSDSLGDAWKGLSYALAGLLQSPNFLYRVEIGTPSGTKGERAFDNWELATRLSFFLWNTTPDDALLAAAQAGSLTKPGGLRTEANRLLASPRARAATRAFAQELLRLDGLDELVQSQTLFPATATLGPAMREETLQLLDDILFAGSGDYRDLLDSPTTFVNKELAKLYGLPAPASNGFERVTLPTDGARVGLLGQGAFLAPNAHETTTSPTRRGKFIREVLLCQAIPAPPPDVMTMLTENKASGPRTMREKLTAHAVPGCAACHSVMDPLGLGLENFDAIGRYRTMDAGKNLDVSGDLDGMAFKSPRELASLLRNHTSIDECLTRGIYRYAMGHVETDGEEPIIGAVVKGVPSGQKRFSALLLGIIESNAFRVSADVM